MQLDDKLFAAAVLEMRESDAFKMAVERINARLFSDWQKTDPLDAETRERAWQQAHAVKLLIHEFDIMATPAVQERAEKRQKVGESAVLRRNPSTA